MDKKETVCAVVVTYNRKELLMECLDSLLKQSHPLDAIYIIDNASTDGTAEILKEKRYIKEILISKNEPLEDENIINMFSVGNQNKEVKVHYVRMLENTGGAGGFYEGVKRGYERGYEWLWLMDDDTEPKEDCLNKLLGSLSSTLSKAVAVAPLRIDKEGEIQVDHAGWQQKDTFIPKHLSIKEYNNDNRLVKIDYSSFVGLLIPYNIIKEIGFPDKSLFIWTDDREYSYRISKCGDMYLVKNSIVKHKDNYKGNKGRFLGLSSKTQRIKILDFWKMYYCFRNSIYIAKKHEANKVKFYSYFLILLFKTIGGVILYDSYKLERIKLLLLSCIDGYKGKMGKILDPKIWIQKFKYRVKNISII